MNLMRPKKTKSIIDRIVDFEMDETGNVQLSEDDKKIYHVLKYAHDLLMDSWCDKDVVQRLKVRHPDIGRSTLYRYVSMSRDCFRFKNEIDIELEKKAWLEMNKKGTRLALDTGNLIAFERFLSQRAKYLKFDQETRTIDPDEYGNHRYYFLIGNIEINIDHAQKLTVDEVERISNTLTNAFADEQQELLTEYVRGFKH